MDGTTSAWTKVASMLSATVSNLATVEGWAQRVGIDKELGAFYEKVVLLNTELNKISSMVRAYDERSTDLLKKLQEVAYGSDDLLDEMDYYRIKDEIEKTRKGLEPDINRHHSISQKIHRISYDLDHCMYHCMKECWLLQRTGNTSNSGTQSLKSMQRMTTSTSPGRVYGRDHEKDYLVMKLLSYDKSPLCKSGVCIVGSVGVGKTALAQLVYNDPRVQKHFDLGMWVSVSSNFEYCTVMHSMGKIHNEEHRRLQSLYSFIVKYKDIVKSNRVFIVVDDMWTGGYDHQREWDSLLADFGSNSEQGSAILVTTRTPSVTQKMPMDMIELNSLEDEDIWKLLKSIIFQDDDWSDGNWSLECTGNQIAKSLKGNPLLAKCIGSILLSCELDDTEWRSVLKAIESTTGDRVKDVLRLSYDILPVNVQQCFSYCTNLFPKNYLFDREDLVRLWIAQGLVDLKSSMRVEDVGNEYFDFLVDRCFLQLVGEGNRSPGNIVDKYRVYDVLYDFAKVVSDNKFTTPGDLHNVEFPLDVRHISVHIKSTDESYGILTKPVEILSSAEPRNLRFSIFVERYSIGQKIFFLEDLIVKAAGLRVLRLNNTSRFPSVLAEIPNFIHLRYLKFFPSLKKLPEAICKLYHLQVLDVLDSKYMNELPFHFNNLVNLRHFVASELLHSMIAGVSKLTSLQELKVFHIKMDGNFGIEQLKNLKELRGSLHICNLSNLRSKEESIQARLAEKEFLNELSLSWSGWTKDCEDVLEGLQPHKNLKSLKIVRYEGGDNNVSWLYNNISTSLVNLEAIYLDDCFRMETLPALGGLPFLKRLHLNYMDGVKEIGDPFYGENHEMGFQSLEHMIIESMSALKSWEGIKGAFICPALQVLEIKNCPELMSLPLPNLTSIDDEEDEWFPYLRCLLITRCPKVQLPPFPHTHTLSNVCIKEVGSSGELFLSISRGELQLKISSDQNISALKEVLVFYNLRNLRSLSIINCPKLEDLSWESLYSLEWLNYMRIEECPSIISLSQGDKSWPSHPSLSKLSTLEIVNCENLMSLPSDFHRLPSLKKLFIIGCKRIKSLPQNGLPETVEQLDLSNCSDELSEQCRGIKFNGKINVI